MDTTMSGDGSDAVAVQVEKDTEEDVSKEAIEEYFYPFVRISPGWDAYEIVKTILMTIFILPIRVILFALFGIIIYLVSKIALIGVDENNPVPLQKYKKTLLNSLTPLIRSMMFICLGVYHIKQTKVEDKSPAYVIVANHTGYLDILILVSMYRGAFVAKGSIKNARIVGTVARALQCLFVVDGQALTETLSKRVDETYECRLMKGCPGCPSCFRSLIIFPEGTTTNGYAMCAMRTGIFVSGRPVKPVIVRFPHKHFNLSWETILLKEHIFRTMTQFKNNAELIECDVYEPTEEDQKNAKLFAQHVQEKMNEKLKQDVYPLSRKHKFAYHKYVLGLRTGAETMEEARKLTEADELLKQLEERHVQAGFRCP